MIKRFNLPPLPSLCRTAQRLLHIQMTILFLASAALILSYCLASRENAVYAALYYSQMIEYLVAGFVLSVGSVCLADRLERENTQS